MENEKEMNKTDKQIVIEWPIEAQIDLVRARIEYYQKEPIASSDVGKHNLSIWLSTLKTLSTSQAKIDQRDKALRECVKELRTCYYSGYIPEISLKRKNIIAAAIVEAEKILKNEV